MTDTMHMQIALAASPQAVFHALTESLAAWFAEFADVSVAEGRYDFWGRFTPETPDREQGRHPLVASESERRLQYRWFLRSADTVVDIHLRPQAAGTVVIVEHAHAPQQHDSAFFSTEDFWFLSLENLRRHLDGKAPVRCDFSRSMTGDIHHTVDIDGSCAAVFETLIRPDQLERWIASQATVEPQVGGRYDFGWNGYGPAKILEITPNEKLTYSWPEANGETVVTWTLEESGGKTRLTLVHSGFAPDQPTGGYQEGWLNFASWVRSIVEYGPSWKPAVLRLGAGKEPFYAASITREQAELVTV